MKSIPLTREAWLLFAVGHVAPIFNEAGYTVPRVRVACAIPATSRRGSAVGQCWPTSRSADQVNEIFISPTHEDPVEVLDTLTHELVHAVDDCKNRHGKEFKTIALAVGLQGKMREASAGPQLRIRLQSIAAAMAAEIGPPVCPKDMIPMEKRGDWEAD